ncbi:hypothetical protein KPL70_005385 [Citrus sinensis]|uniref:Uncharacterized protein n=1 Tax=Citrus sinensis TaxID=2711 RepID=A0ACB8NIV5_CITSI|nr:uncharacterized protein LOC102612917 [Citrus sinensis]KAH9749440.1 hypothetical protein KPL70_005385 [Citrus sinensis]KAH9797786.1 hypothetical protein KPL71_005989 [Citrus sinensis]
MALSSAFRERLEQMEQTRNQRLSILQAEKEVQGKKSQILESKLESVRLTERRCLLLDQKIASQNFKIATLKSEIEILDSKYQAHSQKLRKLKSEIEEVEETEKEKERYYVLKGNEMKEFRENVENFVEECQLRIEELRDQFSKLNSTFKKLQGNNGHLSNPEIVAAEMRKSQLLATKDNVHRNLASKYQLRAQLQMQLQNLLNAQNQDCPSSLKGQS